MQFIYLGEAKFYEERMSEFLSASKNLEIKELSTGIEINVQNNSGQVGGTENKVADKSMDINDVTCDNPTVIGEHIFNFYNKIFNQPIFNQPDPYREGDLEQFLGEEGIRQMGKISPAMQPMLESDFSFWEATQAIDQIKQNKNGGPDKITSDLLKFLFKLSPYLINQCFI